MRSPRAFSLLEVLLALALVALLSGGIFGFLWNLLDRRETLINATADAQSAGAFFEMLEGDISCAVAGDPVRGAGISGDDRSLRVLTRRVWAPAGPDERAAAAGDLQRSEYTFVPSTGIIRLKRSTEGTSAAVEDIVCERVAAFRLRYFDGNTWVGTFDTLSKRDLPVAIEVAIWFGPPGSITAEDELEGWAEDEPAAAPRRSPDRFRIISIADGPTTWWKEMP
jgi:prepilin-type N-terminal cleavage/methylation domain-containing protein